MRTPTLQAAIAHTTVSLLPLLPSLLGCGGDLGGYENIPGEDTALSSARVAVDPRNDNIFFLNEQVEIVGHDEEGNAIREITSKALFRLDPDTLEPRFLLMLSDLSNPVLQFNDQSLLISGHDDSDSQWYRLDRQSLELTDHQVLPQETSLGGASPTGSALLVGSWPTYSCPEDTSTDDTSTADDCVLSAPARLGIVNAWSAEVHELQLGEQSFSVRWLNTSDTLLLTLFGTDEGTDAQPYIRVLSWNYPQLSRSGFAVGEDGLWADPLLDVTFPAVSPDLMLLLGSINLSPDDRTLVLPSYRNHTEEVVLEDGTTQSTVVSEPELQVLDLSTSTVRSFVGAYGPVGFTPDSSTIVAYSASLIPPQGGSEAPVTAPAPEDPAPEDPAQSTDGTLVLMIERDTLTYESLELPNVDQVQYYVTREGAFIIVDTYASDYSETEGYTSSEQLLIYDMDSGDYVTVASDPDLDVDLYEFISRTGHQEIWNVDNGQLYRIAYGEGLLEAVPVEDGNPNLLHYLPNRDRLFLGEVKSSPSETKLWLFDPTTQERVGIVLTADRE